MDDKLLDSLVKYIRNTPDLRGDMDSEQEIILRLEIDDDYLQKVIDAVANDNTFNGIDEDLENMKVDDLADANTENGVIDFEEDDKGNASEEDDEPKDKKNAEEDDNSTNAIANSLSDHRW